MLAPLLIGSKANKMTMKIIGIIDKVLVNNDFSSFCTMCLLYQHTIKRQSLFKQ